MSAAYSVWRQVCPAGAQSSPADPPGCHWGGGRIRKCILTHGGSAWQPANAVWQLGQLLQHVHFLFTLITPENWLTDTVQTSEQEQTVKQIFRWEKQKNGLHLHTEIHHNVFLNVMFSLQKLFGCKQSERTVVGVKVCFPGYKTQKF